jgi:hypothetical protein
MILIVQTSISGRGIGRDGSNQPDLDDGEGEEVEGALVLVPELPLVGRPGTRAAPPLVAGLRRFLSSRARRRTRRGGAALVGCVLGRLALAA